MRPIQHATPCQTSRAGACTIVEAIDAELSPQLREEFYRLEIEMQTRGRALARRYTDRQLEALWEVAFRAGHLHVLSAVLNGLVARDASSAAAGVAAAG